MNKLIILGLTTVLVGLASLFHECETSQLKTDKADEKGKIRRNVYGAKVGSPDWNLVGTE